MFLLGLKTSPPYMPFLLLVLVKATTNLQLLKPLECYGDMDRLYFNKKPSQHTRRDRVGNRGFRVVHPSYLKCVSMFLAERFVFLREEHLALECCTAHSTNEAGVMPSVTKGFQKLVSCLDGELTAVAASPEQTVKILLTVWFSVFQVESVISDWLLTVSAQKAVDMPRLFEGIYHLPQYLVLATAARWSKEIFITVFAVDTSTLLHEADVCQGCSAVDTVKFILMP